jgi:hypothetical protein
MVTMTAAKRYEPLSALDAVQRLQLHDDWSAAFMENLSIASWVSISGMVAISRD